MLHRSAKVKPGQRVLFHGASGGVGTALLQLGRLARTGDVRIVPYSIQTLKRLKPALFRQDLIALLGLLQQQKIKPLIAQRFPLAEARHAQELLAKGGVIGKIVLVRNESARGGR
jgi:NADPH:quinone reductase-like Zn-dependent oxidoreductase